MREYSIDSMMNADEIARVRETTCGIWDTGAIPAARKFHLRNAGHRTVD